MRVFIKTLKFVAILLVILVSAFFLGPKAEKIKLNQLTPKMPSNLLALETKINNSEAAISKYCNGKTVRLQSLFTALSWSWFKRRGTHAKFNS